MSSIKERKMIKRSLGIILVILILLGSSLTYAEEILYQNALQVIVGEASNQGLKGMICVAEVLRRRGSIKGFCGFEAHRQEAPATWDMAAKAWKISAFTNFTKGADHFENVHAFGRPWWAQDCIKTYEYRDHVFYKEVKGKQRRET
jgi:hypothetical protein